MDYKKLGLKIGLEIHQQLDTEKLFCNCPSNLSEGEPDSIIRRKLHAVAGEMGDIDPAALQAYTKDRTYVYKFYRNSACLLELDEEPPRRLNPEALETVLKIALMLDSKVMDELHVMRKTVIDGSNTSGFQRTSLIAVDGSLQFNGLKIKIPTICLEEDAARIVQAKEKEVTYNLDRLGIPLIEIATSPDIQSPEQARDVAKAIGSIIRATGKAKRGIGTIRQDLNISIKGGARVELKGVQDLNSIPKVLENEIKRQQSEKEVKEETRKVLPDCTSKYMRPLPGASRMYPETDLPPIVITANKLSELKKNLPKLPWEQIKDLEKKYSLSTELASTLYNSAYFEYFEKLVKDVRVEPKIIASTFTSTLKSLPESEIELSYEHYRDLFKALDSGKFSKEAIAQVLESWLNQPDKKLDELVKGLGLKGVSKGDLEKLIEKIVVDNKKLIEERGERAIQPLMGLVMKEVRGKADGKLVMEILRNKVK